MSIPQCLGPLWMGSRVQIRIHLDQIESLCWTLACILVLSNHELSFSFFGWNQLIFLPKCCHVNPALTCCFSVLDSHLKAAGPIYSLSSNRIAQFFFDPGSSSSSKVALRREDMKKMVFGIRA